ncbi:hypothetical protein EDC62_0238 [Tibeticola sediminis]|uniref:Uncharacterized protein n=1 Tax=Tibeticola sediminis TaxID=1917811 RepID=A0A3N4V614_9BURK|nr:hypothetical protein [Tibeticola sediminis]RPE72547.1 hypothetical protein EDC62_0238 [Tibeticola sediminis]
MSSLGIAFAVALLASIVPLYALGLDWETAAAVGLLTLIVWPLVVLARRVVDWLYRLLTGRAP